MPASVSVDPMKSRLFRHKERSSYKSSEVLALFLLSIFFGMFCFFVLAAIDYGVQLLLGTIPR